MTTDQVLSFIRTLIKFVGGILVSAGYFDSSVLNTASGAILALVAAVWSFYTHKQVMVPPETLAALQAKASEADALNAAKSAQPPSPPITGV